MVIEKAIARELYRKLDSASEERRSWAIVDRVNKLG